MYVCICAGVTDKEIRKAASEGCRSMRALCLERNVGKQCGKCVKEAKSLLRECCQEIIEVA